MGKGKILPKEHIDDANRYALKIELRRYFPRVFLLFVALTSLSTFCFWNQYDDCIGISFFIFLAAAFYYIGAAQNQAQNAYMQQFAKTHGFAHEELGRTDDLKGEIFLRGSNRRVSHVVSGIYAGHPIRLFMYQYEIRLGRNEVTRRYTACEIIFKGAVPDILVTRGYSIISSFVSGMKRKKLPLSHHFDKHFSVFVPQNLEIETLEIFTPEVMEQILKQGKSFDFEFIDDRLYLYLPRELWSRHELDAMIAFAKYLVETLGPRLSRLHDDVEAMKAIHAQHRNVLG